MLVCSNARITGGFSIFGNTFNVAFWDFPQVRNPIKGCKVMDSFVLLASFEFSVGMYG